MAGESKYIKGGIRVKGSRAGCGHSRALSKLYQSPLAGLEEVLQQRKKEL